MKKTPVLFLMLCSALAFGQSQRMTPETLWSLHRVSGNEVSKNGKYVYYSSKTVDWHTEKSTVHQYRLNLEDGTRKEFTTEGRSICQRYENAWYS